jgi:hypothetical protein
MLAALAAASLSLVGCGAAAGRADQPSIKVGSASAKQSVQPTVATFAVATVAGPVTTVVVEPVEATEPVESAESADDSAENANTEKVDSAPQAASGRPAPPSTTEAVVDADRAIDEADALLAADF